MKNRKGIILAGGTGSRLFPVTSVVTKQLLPIYDKPLIYYPLSVLMLAKIKDILIISTPEDTPRFKQLLKDGSHLGINIQYEVQQSPKGIAEAFIIGKDFIKDDPVALILGDNIFYGHDLSVFLQNSSKTNDGAIIFGYKVNDPKRYGVVEFNDDFSVISIEEKPKDPKSDYAVSGLYFYDNQVVDIASQLKPSNRGEIEITDVNLEYLRQSKLHLKVFGRGSAWLDTGTFDSMQKASNFIQIVQERQNIKIACIEEIAYRLGYISKQDLYELSKKYKNNEYGKYLETCSENIKNISINEHQMVY